MASNVSINFEGQSIPFLPTTFKGGVVKDGGDELRVLNEEK